MGVCRCVSGSGSLVLGFMMVMGPGIKHHVQLLAVIEIKDLFCAPAVCMAFEKHAPGCVSMGSFLYNHIANLKKACSCQVHMC